MTMSNDCFSFGECPMTSPFRISLIYLDINPPNEASPTLPVRVLVQCDRKTCLLVFFKCQAYSNPVSSPVSFLSDSTCLECKQNWQESLETLVSSTIELFFIDLASDFSGACEMQNLFLASDVEVAKIPLCSLVENDVDPI